MRLQRTTLAALALALGAAAGPAEARNPVIVIETSMGTIRAELNEAKAPITVKNFIAYAKSGHYNGTVFHRVIPGFMIQGGGMTSDMREKDTRPPIKNEAANGLKNLRGTLAMARTNDVNSATSQFFISVADNGGLDHNVQGYGYAVFGKVLKGMDVVDKIVAVETTSRGGHRNVPVKPIVIKSVKVE